MRYRPVPHSAGYLPTGALDPAHFRRAGKAFDCDFGETVKWDGDLGIEIAAFWDSALQQRQIGLA